jgi:hypothetical protein
MDIRLGFRGDPDAIRAASDGNESIGAGSGSHTKCELYSTAAEAIRLAKCGNSPRSKFGALSEKRTGRTNSEALR